MKPTSPRELRWCSRQEYTASHAHLMGMGAHPKNLCCRGLTRLEVVVSMVVLILLFVMTTGLTRAEMSKTAGCNNNLRQLSIALLSYADDNAGFFPPRRAGPAWPESLRPYYKQITILTCPSDGPNPFSFGSGSTNIADAAPRSYLLNGWSDYFSAHGLPLTRSFPESAINEPAQTILFGEKFTQSGHYWFDYVAGDDFQEVENGRHLRSGNSASSGASNHAFADGSVRLLKWGAAFEPVNLWFVVPELRTLSP